jgi:FAD/FMN-containing dehydrogenase
MLQHSLLGALLLLPALASAGAHSSSCRCRTSDTCWPSASDWSSLNTTVDGHLVAVRPVGAVCHDPTYDADVCGDLATLRNDSLWLSQQPGALQWENWATRPGKQEVCYLNEDTRTTPCGQGRISLYSVVAQSAAHIQAAVRFAAKHNVRLAIKNSGHDFLGRSSAPESLQILTDRMQSIDVVHDFVPSGGKDADAVPAVTIGAGVKLQPLYKALWAHNMTAVMGTSHTVGAAGGYVQGGGHSLLSAWKGMASDNALQFEVVTAKGDLVVANAHNNSDLFWALRGGGGGTFGVVTSATLRAYDDPPAVFTSFRLNTTDNAAYQRAVELFHARLPAINDANGTGYYFITPQLAPDATAPSLFRGVFLFADQTDQAAVDALLSPVMTDMADAIGHGLEYLSYAVPRTQYVYDQLIKGHADGTGAFARLGSRLVSRDFLLSVDGPRRLAEAFAKILPHGGPVLGHVVSGGQAARNAASVDSALLPAWRRALTHVIVVTGWDAATPWDEQRRLAESLTHDQVALLKDLEPDMGAYPNEADADETDWQASFWGANYPRLRDVKSKWDPDGLFIVRRGVGSEDWDEDGLCRV